MSHLDDFYLGNETKNSWLTSIQQSKDLCGQDVSLYVKRTKYFSAKEHEGVIVFTDSSGVLLVEDEKLPVFFPWRVVDRIVINSYI